MPVFSLFIPKDLQHLSRRLYSLSSYHCVELHAAITEETKADCVRLRRMTNTAVKVGGAPAHPRWRSGLDALINAELATVTTL